MINGLKLQRFRAFKGVDFEFRPLTIIAGQNSSGKSSIIQALNAILQTSQERTFPFDLTLNGERAQLGGFRNVVHGHDARHSVGVSIDFSIDDSSVRLSSLLKNSNEEGHLFPRSVSAEHSSIGHLQIDWNQKSHSFRLVVNPLDSFIGAQQESYVSRFARVFASAESGGREAVKRKLSLKDDSDFLDAMRALYSAAAEEGRAGLSFEAESFGDFLKDVESIPLFDPFRARIATALSTLKGRCRYIGPMRAKPSRYFPLAGSVGSYDSAGEGTSSTLARWKERRSSLIGEVRQALSTLELASDIIISVEHDEFLKIGIKPHGRSYSDSIADVGFGLSQVLPMIVGDINLVNKGTLIVNQPEIHLHPSSQALLANYFCERLDRRQYIIETHSEYLINRVRLLVARGDVSSDDVVIIYCESDGRGASRVHHIGVRGDGALEGAPDEFFSTYTADAFNIAMAVMDDD